MLLRLTRRWVPVIALVAACDQPGGGGAGGDRADEADCAGIPIVDFSVDSAIGARPDLGKRLAKLKDPIARVLQSGCPTSYAALLDALEKVQAKSCPGGVEPSLTSFLISETVEPAGGPVDDFRLVIKQGCGADLALIAPLGTDPETAALELIGIEPTRGVFNYYALNEFNDRPGSKAEWHFYGSGLDFVAGGPGSASGAQGEPEGNQVRRCANCHVSGGLVMKELTAPWLHWCQSGSPQCEMLRDLVSERQQVFGRTSGGLDLQTEVVEPRNAKFNRARIDHIVDNLDAETLLEPLFCTPEINIDATNPEVTDIDSGYLVDEVLLELAGVDELDAFVTFDDAVYKRMIRDADQKLAGFPKKRDTAFAFAHPVAAQIDHDYIRQLIKQKLVTEAFVRRVLFTDFTRPVFSDTRCQMLRDSDARNTPAKVLTPQKLAALFPDLASPTAGEQKVAIAKFVTACQARMDAEAESTASTNIRTDVMQTLALRRARARSDLDSAPTVAAGAGVGVIEFANTMPISDLDGVDGELDGVRRDAFLDPATCKLRP